MRKLMIPSLSQSPHLLNVDGALRSFGDIFKNTASGVSQQVSSSTEDVKARAAAFASNPFSFISQPLPQASLEALAAKYDLEMPDVLDVQTSLALRS